MTDRVETLLRQAMTDEAGRAPAPGDLAGAARGRVARRRRTVLESVGAAAVVIAVIAGAALVVANRPTGPDAAGPDPIGSPAPTPVVAPPGTRLVGYGNAAIAVPKNWGTNEVRCGVPQKDTVVIDHGPVESCATSRPPRVESVELWQGEPRDDFTPDETVEIDGVDAQRQRTSCTAGPADTGVLCHGSIYLPSLEAGFLVTSSTGPEEVDEILSWVRIVPDAVGVPGYQMVTMESPQEKSKERYVAALQAVGLSAEILTKKMPAMPPEYVLGISPAAGTMVAPGSVVTVTVVADPEGPADEVRVGVNSEDTKGEFHDLDDAAIRAGATIELGVGDRIWAYADGKRAGTLAGELEGDSLEIDGWKEGPNYPHSWVATGPGRTQVTLTITADGAPVVLGVVTVVVR